MDLSELLAWKQALKNMLLDLKPNYFITFCYGRGIGDDATNRHIKHWFNRVQRILYGPTWTAQFDREWPIAFCFLEHRDLPNPHKHCLARVPKKFGRWAEVHGEELWKEVTKRGQLDVQEIYRLPSIVNYCLKDFIRCGGYENLYIYKDTRIRTGGQNSSKCGRET